AEVAVERQSGLGGSGTRVRERNGEDCVRAELLLVLRPVERNHRAVDVDLIEGVKPDNLRGDALDHVLDRLAYALAEITILVLVAQLDRFVLSGGRSARHGRAPGAAALENDLRFYRGIPARVEDLARMHTNDCRHVRWPGFGPARRAALRWRCARAGSVRHDSARHSRPSRWPG